MKRIKDALVLAIQPFLLTGCGGGLLATVGPDYRAPDMPVADRWQSPQPDIAKPHGGNVAALKRWWDRFNDPVLARFLASAQLVSASVAEAASRIQQSRAGLIDAEAAGLPNLDAKLESNWSSFTFGGPTFDWERHQVGLQSNWEVDLFGGLARQREAARSQLEARTASWHDARVAVAVEVADTYLGYRHCQVLLKLAEADAASRGDSARVTAIAGHAGLRSPADVALANASAAEGRETLLRQQGQCDRTIKSLVALTGLSEPEIRQRLSTTMDQPLILPSPPPFRIDGLPAQVLRQRPDVAAAERDLAEASASIGVEEAKRFPKLSLSGNITPTLQSVNGAALFLAQTWAVGPTLSLPLFDAGKKAADVDAALARYQASLSRFRATARTAAKEVEDALVRVRNAEIRLPETRVAAHGYRVNFRATEQSYRTGFGTLIDAEASRRQSLAADRTVADLEQERAAAWIALYRAAGGSWDDAWATVPAGGGGAPNPGSKSLSTVSAGPS